MTRNIAIYCNEGVFLSQLVLFSILMKIWKIIKENDCLGDKLFWIFKQDLSKANLNLVMEAFSFHTS